MEWKEVQGLQERIRAYQEDGAIGVYEIRVLANGERYDAYVLAEVPDPAKLAELRGLPRTAPASAASHDRWAGEAENPSVGSSPTSFSRPAQGRGASAEPR